ncbi:protein CLN8 [Lingula anatina]|uniref:Protein CLN8 n=1 Tax=Lingula anatina TaxID=7574 RepID=A0A1S3K4K2_LINAN|nr:protein CLN8 [Lingula anatina]|eukprot:XP_013417452.1 protein CLN8 [Lingula anatina]
MGLVEYIHPTLETLDYTSPRVQLEIIGSSFLFFFVVYLASAFIASMTWTYRNLRIKEKVFWNLSVVRAVFGVYSTCAGVWAVWWDTELKEDVVFATTPTSWFSLCLCVGFFLFECSAMFVSDVIFRQANPLLNLHHWLALLGYVLVMVYRSSHFFGTVGLLLEMSTPFSALCWTLLKCGLSDTLLWKLNQFVLVHTFHCRSLLECYLWLQSYRNWERIWQAMPTPIFTALYVQLTLIFFIMTPYWTYKKTVQLVNHRDWNFEDTETTKETNGSLKTD